MTVNKNPCQRKLKEQRGKKKKHVREKKEKKEKKSVVGEDLSVGPGDARLTAYSWLQHGQGPPGREPIYISPSTESKPADISPPTHTPQ